MFPVSNDYKDYISRRTVKYGWGGTITFKNNTSISFTGEQIDQNKSKIIRQCVSGENLEVGNAFAAELRLTLRDTASWSISSQTYNYYDAVVVITFYLYDSTGTLIETVPCGHFIVTEAERTYHTVTLTAYDKMNKFNKKLEGDTVYTDDMSPYSALASLCYRCGVTLGMKQLQIEALPNGTRTDLKLKKYKKGTSYKEILNGVCTVLGCIAYCDRYGNLRVTTYGQESVRAIDSSERYNSSYIDYIGRYSTIYAVNKKGEVDEFSIQHPSASERQLSMNIGKSILINAYTNAVRENIIRAVLTYIHNIKYCPCNVTMPADPSIDVADMVSIIGGEITGTYIPTTDTTVDPNKTYYERAGATYVEVTPVGDENPSEEYWYVAGANLICTKIEMPFYGQMKITSLAGSYELDADYYATEKEQQQQQDNNDNEDRWEKQEETNEDNEEAWERQEEVNEDVEEQMGELSGDIENLSARMAVNYIFPYAVNTNPISDGSSAYVLRFRFKCDRDGDTVAFYSMVSFTVSTTVSNNAYNDLELTVTYEMDGSTIATAVHTYDDGYAILTLNGIMAEPTAGDHTFDVKFACSGGGIS